MAPELEQAEVVIVGVTHARDNRVCVGALDAAGRSYRLHDADQEFRSGDSPPAIGERWVIKYEAAPDTPPHVEDVHVHELRKRPGVNPTRFIDDHARVHDGPIEHLFLGALVPDPKSNRGKLCLAPGRVPGFSVQFCRVDRDLWLDTFETPYGNKIYSYRAAEQPQFAVKYVGVRRPPAEWLDAGTLVRFSLAKWWKPSSSPDEEPEVCSLQLSGWFED